VVIEGQESPERWLPIHASADRGNWPAVTRRDALHASVLDAEILAEKGQLVLYANGVGDAVARHDRTLFGASVLDYAVE